MLFKTIKNLTIILGLLLIISCSQTSNDVKCSQNKKQDTIINVTTIAVFDGIIINKYGYKINEYCIAFTDLTDNQVDSLKGKKVMVSGKLNIVKSQESKHIQSSGEDKKIITEPKFTIVYDSEKP